MKVTTAFYTPTFLLSLLGAMSIALNPALASNHDTTPAPADDLLGGDSFDLLLGDDFEVMMETDDTPSWLKTLGFSLEESLGFSKKQSNLFLHQTTATATWSGSLSPAWFAQWDVSGQVRWPHVNLLGGTPVSHESELLLNAAFLQYSVGPISAKLGQYSLGWGELEGAGVLDIVNPAPDLTQGSLSAAGNGQWLLSSRYYGNGWELSGFYNLAPQLADMSAAGLDAPSLTDPEFGLRWATHWLGSDVSLYAGQFIEDTPLVVFSPTPTATVANNYALIGVAANKALGSWLLKTDIAYKQNMALYSGTFPALATNQFNRLDFGAGFEFSASGGQQFGVTLYGRQWQNLDGSSGALVMGAPPTLPSVLVASNLEAGALVRFSDQFMHDDLSFSVMATGDLSGAMVMASTVIGYRFNDQWDTELQLTQAKAATDSPYASFDGELLAVWTLTWQY